MSLNLKGLFSGGLKGLADSAKDIIQQVGENKIAPLEAQLKIDSEINRHAEAMEASAVKEMELQLADTKSARDSNATIQQSENSSWLAKNVGYIIDLLLLIAFLVMLSMIFFHTVPEENHELFYVGFGTLGGYLGTSINFHRGTSQGSHEKQKMLDRMMRK